MYLCSVSAFQAQNFGIVASSIQTGGGGFTGILDDVPGASIAIGTRKLDKDYTGSIIRIIRASDSSEQDIGASGEDIDEGAINTFCSGTTCYVGIAYDQSGNSHDAYGKGYPTQTELPIIYESGAIVKLNGKAAFKITHPRVFEWTEASASLSDFLTPGNSSTKAVTVHMVGQQSSSSGGAYKFIINSASDVLWCYESSSAERTDFVATSASSGTVFTDDAQKEWIWRVSGGSHTWHENGTQIASSTNNSTQNTTQTNLTFNIGGLGFSTRNMEGYVQELIVWKPAETVATIFSNADTYYSIP